MKFGGTLNHKEGRMEILMSIEALGSDRIEIVNEGRGTGCYVGRGSPLGNKFRIGVHGNRDTVIRKYRV